MSAEQHNILAAAYRGKYAIGAFNGYNYETFQGIVNAGRIMQQPVIIAFGEKYLRNMPLAVAAALVNTLKTTTDFPLWLHLDHCSNVDIVFQAIRNGFDSVMYDGSALSLAENISNTKKVCEVAHACGVFVEAELGSLAAGAHSHEGSASDRTCYTDPTEAAEFVKRTGVDALAVSIGTVHGLYQGEPELRLDILTAINETLSMPLVLHGGSGLTQRDFSRCIANGIAKINVNTEISTYAVAETAKLLQQKQPHFSQVSLFQSDAVTAVVKKYIEYFTKVI